MLQMTKEYTTVRMDKEQHDQLVAVKDKTGVPVAKLVRWAINDWLDKRPQFEDEIMQIFGERPNPQ